MPVKDPICCIAVHSAQFPSDLCSWQRSDMQKPPIPIGSGALGQDPICKNLQFPSDLARSAKIRYAKTSNSHRILHARPRSDMQKLSISIGSAPIIGSVLHYRIRKMASSDLFGTVSDLVDAISDLSAVKYRCNMPPQTLILPIQDTLSYNLGEISDLSFQSALCIQARF